MSEMVSGLRISLQSLGLQWGDDALANFWGTQASASAADEAGSAMAAMNTPPETAGDSLAVPTIPDYSLGTGANGQRTTFFPKDAAGWLAGKSDPSSQFHPETLANAPGILAGFKKDAGLPSDGAGSHWFEPQTYIAVLVAVVIVFVGLSALANTAQMRQAVAMMKGA